MSSEKQTYFSENRLISFGGEFAPGSELPSSQLMRNASPEVQRQGRDFLNKVPTFTKFYDMSPDQYRSQLSRARNVDDILPQSKAAQEIRTSIEAMVSDLEKDLKGFDDKNPNFEKAFAAIGRSIDKHFVPLMRKLEKNPELLAEFAVQHIMREKIQDDLGALRVQPDVGLVSPRQLFDNVLSRRTRYERILQSRLNKGESVQQISAKSKTSLSDPNIETQSDAQAMLDAIDHQKMMREATRTDLKGKFGLAHLLNDDVQLNLDVKDLDIVFDASPESINRLVKAHPENVKRKDDRLTIRIDSKPYAFEFDKAENVYELKI